jgi:hypothetical protein
MKIPNNDIPADMNWADYCDALSNERFLRTVYDRKTFQDPEHQASVAEDEESHVAKVSPLP